MVPIRLPVSQPSLGTEEAAVVQKVLESRWLGTGAVTQEFEETIADYVGAAYVLATNSGSSALDLAFSTVIEDPEDEVIVPALTFISTAQMVIAAGGRPVFGDVNPETLTLDPVDVEHRITPRTRAIVPMHFGGEPAAMDPLRAIADRHGAVLLDDAAHAFGGTYNGRRIGGLADISCFSFGPVKNITCGEGGAVCTNRKDWYERMRLRRNLGINTETWQRQATTRHWDYSVEGYGLRYPMANINAAIGLAQFGKLERFRQRKREIADRYTAGLGGLETVRLLTMDLDHTHRYTYSVRIPGGCRDELSAHLRRQGIGAPVHYRPLHMQPALHDPKVSLPVTEQVFTEIISLPYYVDLTDADVDEVIGEVTGFLKRQSPLHRSPELQTGDPGSRPEVA